MKATDRKATPSKARSSWSSLRSQAGMTAAELVVTLSIASVLGLTAQPSISEIRHNYDLQAATQQVFAALQESRTEAVMGNQPYKVRLGVEGKRVVVKKYDKASDTWTLTERLQPLLQNKPGLNITFSDEILFVPDGTAVSCGTITITAANAEQKQIVVSPAGGVRIQ